MITAETLTAVQNSYGRCSLKEGFWDTFYDTFLKSSPQVAAKFKNTDLKRQKEILRSSLTFVFMYAKDEKAAFAKTKLTEVGVVHSRANRDIAPQQYDLWIKSLMSTLRHYEGDKFTAQLEKDWREVLAPAVKLMQSQY